VVVAVIVDEPPTRLPTHPMGGHQAPTSAYPTATAAAANGGMGSHRRRKSVPSRIDLVAAGRHIAGMRALHLGVEWPRGPVWTRSDQSFAVVATQATSTNVQLVEAFWRLGVPAALLHPEVAETQLCPADVALGRLDVLPTLDGIERGLGVLRRLVAQRVRVLNPADALMAAHDKAVTARLLARNRIPHPRTMVLQPGNTPARLVPPVVLKPRFGSWGRDVFLCQSREELHNCLNGLRRRSWFHRHGALVQEYVPGRGYDLRVLVANGEVMGAIRRVAAPNEWRTNVALGGRREPIHPPAQVRALAGAAATAVGGDFVGVDLHPVQRGRFVVLEVNGAVDFTEEYAPAGLDVFEKVAGTLAARSLDRTAAVP
jgi:RimK family alpha-L-glutamate ligase